MDVPLRQISEAAATTVTVSKFATPSALAATTAATYFGENTIAWLGLGATIFFGALGVCVNWYFRHKEHKLRLAEARRADEAHEMAKIEHKATLLSLAKKE